VIRAAGLLALATTLTVAAPASAYVRARTEAKLPVHWLGSCVYVQPDSAGSPDLPAADVFATIQRSISNWSDALGTQTYLQLKYSAPTGPAEAHLDGKNIVKFRTDRWCHPNDDQQNNVCYDAKAAAITTVFFVQDGDSKAGAIEDTDIELNDINFFFVNVDPSRPPTQAPAGRTLADLENTLTHELGHAMGLDHTCADDNTPPQEVDETGSPPPRCSALPLLTPAEREKITTATMYNTYEPGETIKRHPHPDDLAGIVASYPAGKDPKSCKPTDLDDFAHGCAFMGGGSRSLASLGMLAAALVALVARRRRRRS
jgi:hypothetical protein